MSDACHGHFYQDFYEYGVSYGYRVSNLYRVSYMYRDFYGYCGSYGYCDSYYLGDNGYDDVCSDTDAYFDVEAACYAASFTAAETAYDMVRASCTSSSRFRNPLTTGQNPRKH